MKRIRTNVNTFSEVRGSLDAILSWLREGVRLLARKTDPANPPAGEAVLWLATGDGVNGDDGDVMLKVTDSNGTTKVGTIYDFSAG